MTREEAKRLLEIEKECMNCDPSRLCYDSYLKPVCENYPFKESHSWEEAIYVAIKALSAIEDIRADIELAKWCDKTTKLVKNANASGLEVALDIIDKHISGKDSE